MARVLQVVTELVVGGASLTMLDFAEDLATEHEMVIAHGRLDAPGSAAARRAHEHFPTYELPRLARPLDPRADLDAARAFASLCRHVRPDVIHTHSSKAGFVGRLGAWPGASVHLHSVHGWGHTPLDRPARRGLLVGAERLAALRTTRLIAVSQEVRDEGLALGIGRPSQYAVIGAPVDMRPHRSDFDSARAQARARLRLPHDAEVIGWVGRFSAQKDPETLVTVLAETLRRRHNAYAVLIGEDARELYAAYDVLLHTSRWEGHPRAVREALAERVPVVSARVGGTGVLAGDERLGALVQPGDSAAFRDAIELILDSPTRRAPVEPQALAGLRADADVPYGLMRELYATTLAQT